MATHVTPRAVTEMREQILDIIQIKAAAELRQ